MVFYELSEEDRNLITSALKTLERNFDDGVYNHTVGCALKCENGNVFTGVDCDGIHGSCAEDIALGAAISAGERNFKTIVAVHSLAPNKVVSPCGNCRQMLLKYAPDVKVILNDDTGKLVKVSIKDLLPFAWKSVKCD